MYAESQTHRPKRQASVGEFCHDQLVAPTVDSVLDRAVNHPFLDVLDPRSLQLVLGQSDAMSGRTTGFVLGIMLVGDLCDSDVIDCDFDGVRRPPVTLNCFDRCTSSTIENAKERSARQAAQDRFPCPDEAYVTFHCLPITQHSLIR